ncbi:MAG: hypothetical protein JNK97_07485 [Zoogloea sp.]|nr:hypothetical protein [Zoogloea sp.]
MRKLILATLASSLLISLPQHTNADVVSSVSASATTSLVIDKIRDTASDLINQGTEKGDYLLARAGIEARIAIENFALANNKFLDKAFGELDKASQDSFAKIDAAMQQAKSGAITAAEATRKITESGEQIGVILDLQGHRSYVTRYFPSVAYPGKKSSYLITVRGVNLDEANATLKAQSTDLKPNITGKQELVFELPPTLFGYKETESQVSRLKLNYQSIKPGFFNRLLGLKENISRDIIFLVLPNTMGSFGYTTTLSSTKRTTDPRDYWHEFQGRNDDHRLAIAPPPGWKIDVGTLNHQQGDGKAGDCNGYDPNGKSEFGVVYMAHTGEYFRDLSKKPGYVKCRLIYSLYKDDPIEIGGPTGDGNISWTSDTTIPIPENMKSFALNVTTFDGIKRTYGSSGDGKFYQIIKEANRYVIRPQIPLDFSN